MPNLKEFVAALQAGWFPAFVALVGCTLIIGGDYLEIPYLNNTPEFLITISVVIGVFSFSIIVANIVYIPVLIWRKYQRYRAKKELKAKIADEIKTAPQPEIIILAYLATSGRKAFAAEFNDRRLAPLVSKGLIVKMGGTNSILEWPYMVRDEVWDYLMENKEAFRIELPEDGHDPFNWRSGW